jgi:hypothetical protein
MFVLSSEQEREAGISLKIPLFCVSRDTECHMKCVLDMIFIV